MKAIRTITLPDLERPKPKPRERKVSAFTGTNIRWFEVPNAIVGMLTKLKLTELRLLLFILRETNDSGSLSVEIENSDIEKLTGLSGKELRATRDSLKKKKLIEVGKAKKTSKRYEIINPANGAVLPKGRKWASGSKRAKPISVHEEMVSSGEPMWRDLEVEDSPGELTFRPATP